MSMIGSENDAAMKGAKQESGCDGRDAREDTARRR
jgi:hypothetical protein